MDFPALSRDATMDQAVILVTGLAEIVLDQQGDLAADLIMLDRPAVAPGPQRLDLPWRCGFRLRKDPFVASRGVHARER